MKHCLGLFGLLALCWACTPQDPAPTATASTAIAPALRPSEYFSLRGEVGGLPIVMNLMREATRYDTGWFYQGYYYYDKYAAPIALYGYPDSVGQVVLSETGGWQNEPHQFIGSWAADGTFSGTWRQGDGSRQLPFALKPTPGAIRFEAVSLLDSAPAVPTWANSPSAYFRSEWLEPRTGHAPLDNFLRTVIRQGMLGDSLAGVYPATRAGIEVMRDVYFADYQAEMKEMLAEGVVDTSDIMPFNYETSRQMVIYYTTDSLLTLGYNDYYYTGGAHGMYGTSVHSYDLQAQRTISLTDVLKPGYEKVVGEALAKAVRSKYSLTAQQALSEVLFDEEVAPNENFGLTEKGIFFVYTPYEIAAYAAGEIELFVSFEDILPVLTPAYAAKVAAQKQK